MEKFGNFELGTKGGYKYSDLDGDLTTTGDRTALKLWTINLYKDVNGDGKLDAGDGAAIATDTTDDNGYYEFTGLNAGKYLVAEDCKAGWIQLDPKPLSNTEADCGTGIHPITVTSGFSDKNNNFINFELGTKGGYKYSDLDGDLTTTGDRTALKWWTINLFKDVNGDGKLDAGDGAAIATDTTDDNGYYEFTGLKAGKYLVAEDCRAGLDPVGPEAPLEHGSRTAGPGSTRSP